MTEPIRIGLIGARGYVGAELIRLIADDPRLTLNLAASRRLAGRPVSSVEASYSGDLVFTRPAPPAAVAADIDVCILALPNGKAADYVVAFDAGNPAALLLDLSADFRFDPRWVYSVPELDGGRLAGARRIANPGCYATAAQLAIAPLAGRLAGPVQVTGISGYSGAGTTPSPRNDPARLADNIIAYGLTGHGHEAEMSRRAGVPVWFTPHVAPFFRGLTVTVNLGLEEAEDAAGLQRRFEAFYDGAEDIVVTDGVPEIRDVVGSTRCHIGGFAADPGNRRAVVVAVLDNLLKGAASQALRNIDRALG